MQNCSENKEKMKKEKYNKKILVVGLLAILLIVIIGVIFIKNTKDTEEVYMTPPPEEVVRQYFTAWNNKNYQDMYAVISDGFKKIEPTAKDLNYFRTYASSQGVESVKIIAVELESMTMDGMNVEKDMMGMPGMQAIVAYTVEFTFSDGTKREFSDKFTLKFREGDVIIGWKLIHPYGNNIDTS